MALITVTSPFLEKLNYSELSAGEQALVAALIDAGEDWIEDYCERHFAAADYTDEVLDGTGENAIFVKNPPINTLTDIDVIDGATTTTYAASKFKYHSESGEIRFATETFTSGGSYFPEGFQNVQITYNGGFSTVPPIIKKLVADFAIELFDPSLAEDQIEKEKLGDYFYSKGTGYYNKLNFSTRKLLSRYKLRNAIRR